MDATGLPIQQQQQQQHNSTNNNNNNNASFAGVAGFWQQSQTAALPQCAPASTSSSSSSTGAPNSFFYNHIANHETQTTGATAAAGTTPTNTSGGTQTVELLQSSLSTATNGGTGIIGNEQNHANPGAIATNLTSLAIASNLSSSCPSSVANTVFQTIQQQQPNHHPPFVGPPFHMFNSANRTAETASAGIQHPNVGFRPTLPIGGGQFGGGIDPRHFSADSLPASLFHANPHVPFSSAAMVASVGFDYMGLMNNAFGFNQTGTAPNNQSQFAVPSMGGVGNFAVTQATSAALMPLAMSAIYAGSETGAINGIQRSSSTFLQNSSPARDAGALTLSQSISSGALTANHQQLQQQQQSCNNAAVEAQSRQLFDLSNQIANAGGSAASMVAAAAVAAATGTAPRSFSTAPNEQQNRRLNAALALDHLASPQTHQQQHRENPASMATFNIFGGTKSVASTSKVPKETAMIPLESSSEASYSSASGGTEQRVQTQMGCQVCHLAASNGLHFGARTCAACAAFFRRSISDQKRYICKRSQRCVVRASENGTQGYRKMCRNCRMKKCIEIGMLPENVQNKRNKREYYFVDALNNAVQQQKQQNQQSCDVVQGVQRRQSLPGEGLMGQQHGQNHLPPQMMMALKNEHAKLFMPLGNSTAPVDVQHQQQQQQKLNPVEKFEPVEKTISSERIIAEIRNQEQNNEMAQQSPQFHSAVTAFQTHHHQQQQHLLPPTLMSSLMNNGVKPSS